MTIATLAALVLATAPGPRADTSAAARVAGHWEGAFARMGSVQLAEVDLRVENGALAGTFRIAELGVANEPLRDVSVTDSTISFRLTYGLFEMRIDSAATELGGSNPRWNPPVTLHLKRAAPVVAYDTEKVRIPAAGATIEGTLYLPRRRDAAPLVIVAGGSEQATRAPWEYRAWGDVLARHGIAAFVYDRRGHGASTGPAGDPDLRTEAADVVAMANALAARPDVDRARIAVLGASRGGWVATLAAAGAGPISMLLLESAPAVTPAEQELQRIARVEPDDSVTAADVAAASAYERAWLRAAVAGASWRTIDRLSAEARRARWHGIAAIPDSAGDAAWWRRNDVDPAATLRSLRIPVLALFGAGDRVVPADENVARMREALAGNPRAIVRVLPEAGHGLWLFGTLRGGEWKWPTGWWRWARKAPGAYDAVIAAMTDGIAAP